MFKFTRAALISLFFVALSLVFVSNPFASNFFPPERGGTIMKYLHSPIGVGEPRYWYDIITNKQVINGLNYYNVYTYSHEGFFDDSDEALYRSTGSRKYIRNQAGLEYLLMTTAGRGDLVNVCDLFGINLNHCYSYFMVYGMSIFGLELSNGDYYSSTIPVQIYQNCDSYDMCYSPPENFYDYYAADVGLISNNDADGEVLELAEVIPPKISWFFMNKRNYENGFESNRVSFGFEIDFDHFHAFAPVDDYVSIPGSIISLYDSEGGYIPFISPQVSGAKLSLNIDTHSEDIGYWSDFQGEIAEMNPGSYTLFVVDDFGNMYNASWIHDNTYPQIPYIRASTFNTWVDSGYWFWTWALDSSPDPPSNNFQTRLYLRAFQGSNFLHSYYLNQPLGDNSLVLSYADYLAPGNLVRLETHTRYGQHLRNFSNWVSFPIFDSEVDGVLRSAGNGIEDDIEASNEVFDRFDYEGTTGVILDKGDMTLAVVKEAGDTGEVLIIASCADVSGVCTAPAQVSVCEDITLYTFTTDAEFTALCGSVHTNVKKGLVNILFKSDDGSEYTTEVNEGNGLYFDPETNLLEADTNNPDQIIVTIDGKDILLSPGDTKTLVEIDIRPKRESNCFNNNGHGGLPVAIFGSNIFDVEMIDVSTLSLEGLSVRERGKKQKLHARLKDVNKDGFMDLRIKFEDNGAIGDISDGTAVLTGALVDGTPIEGVDDICLVP